MKKNLQVLVNNINRIKRSASITCYIFGTISTVMSVIGVSLHCYVLDFQCALLIVAIIFMFSVVGIYYVIGKIYNKSVSLKIGCTSVSISYGDIFKTEGWRVIGCDTHFDTRVDDIYISRKSLQGQLIQEHGTPEEINIVVEEKARELHLNKNENGFYDFPLGTIIRYDSSVDNCTYLMLAMTELNESHEAHTNMAKYVNMLMKMWTEIDRIYAQNEVTVPLLGTGITRFDNGLKGYKSLLRCILYTLNNSGVTLNTKLNIVIFYRKEELSLYEFKYILNSLN